MGGREIEQDVERKSVERQLQGYNHRHPDEDGPDVRTEVGTLPVRIRFKIGVENVGTPEVKLHVPLVLI